MKINKVNQLSTNNTVNKGNQNEKTNPSKSEEPDDLQSNVHLSTAFSNLGDAATANSVLNINKIAEIKQAMVEGRFRVNPEVVADRLLETVKELIQSDKKV